MDPFEEFEFKPLTEGLGFHKKKGPAQKASDLDSSFEVTKPVSKNKKSTDGLSLLEEETVDPLRPPLPRKSSTPMSPEPETSPSSSAVDEILKTLQKNRRLDFENKTANKVTAPAAKVEEFKPDVWNFSSAFLDGMLVWPPAFSV